MTDDIHTKLLRYLQVHPQATQRELAQAVGISLGRTNYCVRALIARGWLKAQNFLNSNNKHAYRYLLTPQGLEAKARLTAGFLQRKQAEYQTLKAEIAALSAEIASSEPRPSAQIAQGHDD